MVYFCRVITILVAFKQLTSGSKLKMKKLKLQTLPVLALSCVVPEYSSKAQFWKIGIINSHIHLLILRLKKPIVMV